MASPPRRSRRKPAPPVVARGRLSVRLFVGIVCCVVGVVWVGQGVGIIGGSFMTGEAVWAVIGAVAILFGAVLIRSTTR